jgi:hypothetical protein
VISGTASGCSGAALVRKLGIRAAQRVLLLDAPKEYRTLLAPLPDGVVFAKRAGLNVDLVHAFVTRREELERHLVMLRERLRPDAVIWVSWPKRSAAVPTTVTENVIRELALPLGFVYVKVCAVSEIWSGLKLVVRRELRG